MDSGSDKVKFELRKKIDILTESSSCHQGKWSFQSNCWQSFFFFQTQISNGFFLIYAKQVFGVSQWPLIRSVPDGRLSGVSQMAAYQECPRWPLIRSVHRAGSTVVA